MTILRILFEIRRKIISGGCIVCRTRRGTCPRFPVSILSYVLLLGSFHESIMIIFRPCSSFSGHLFRSLLLNPSGGLGQGVSS